MIWVALAAIGVVGATVIAFAGLIRSMLRSQARERDLLVNQLCHLARNPWQPPPADAARVELEAMGERLREELEDLTEDDFVDDLER